MLARVQIFNGGWNNIKAVKVRGGRRSSEGYVESCPFLLKMTSLVEDTVERTWKPFTNRGLAATQTLSFEEGPSLSGNCRSATKPSGIA
jgi:hypothetical protein